MVNFWSFLRPWWHDSSVIQVRGLCLLLFFRALWVCWLKQRFVLVESMAKLVSVFETLALHLFEFIISVFNKLRQYIKFIIVVVRGIIVIQKVWSAILPHKHIDEWCFWPSTRSDFVCYGPVNIIYLLNEALILIFKLIWCIGSKV